MFNHSSNGSNNFGNVVYLNPNFTLGSFTAMYTPSPVINFSAAPHYYTTCYDDTAQTITRWVDGVLVYSVNSWQWVGPNANTVVDLAAGSSGGTYPGTIPSPATFSANMDLYSIAYYTPYSQYPSVTAKAGQLISSYAGTGPVASTYSTTALAGAVAGDSIVIGVNWCDDVNCNAAPNGNTISSITDSFGSTCSPAIGADAHASVNKFQTMIWYCPSLAGGGSEVLTLHFSVVNSAYYVYVEGNEFTHIGGDEGVGTFITGTTNVGSAYPIVTTNGATTVNNDLIFANLNTLGDSCDGSGFLTQLVAGASGGHTGYMLANAPATYTGGFKCGGGKPMTFSIAAFRPTTNPIITTACSYNPAPLFAAPPNIAATVIPLCGFTNSLGIGLHSASYGDGWDNCNEIQTLVINAGWTLMRGPMNGADSTTDNNCATQLMAAGLRVLAQGDNAFANHGGQGSQANANAAAATFVASLKSNGLTGITGIEEFNEANCNPIFVSSCNANTSWATQMQQWAIAMHSAFKGDPATANIILYPANINGFGTQTQSIYTALGDLSAYIDRGDIHGGQGYLCCGGGADIATNNFAANVSWNGEKTVAGTSPSQGYGNSEYEFGTVEPPWVRGVQYLQSLFVHLQWGAVENQVFQLLDTPADGTGRGFVTDANSGFQLKDSYLIAQAAFSLLRDTVRVTSPTFLPFAISGNTAAGTDTSSCNGNSEPDDGTKVLEFEKSDGSYWFAVWQGFTMWCGITPESLKSPLPSHSVTLTFSGTKNYTVYRPIDQNDTINGTTPIASSSGSSITFGSQTGVTLIHVVSP
jgi:hypothetical protein